MNKKINFNKLIDVKAYINNIFNFCECVDLEDIIPEIKKFLEWAFTDPMARCNYSELYNNSGIFYIISSVFENADLITHGISIRTCELSINGRLLLKALNKFTIKEICDVKGEAYDEIFYD